MQKACRVKGRRQAQRGTTLFCRGRRRALRPRRDNGLVPGPAYWPFSGAAREGIPRAVRSGFQPGTKNAPAAFSGADELSGIVSFIADGRNYIIEETGLQAIQALRAAKKAAASCAEANTRRMGPSIIGFMRPSITVRGSVLRP